MSEWYYRGDNGREHGPIGSSKLLDLIRQGDVSSETQVRKDESPWVRACEVNGLWQAAGLPSVRFRCPQCDAEISKPPTRCAKCKKNVEKAVGQLVTHTRPSDNGWTEFQRTENKPKAPPLQ